MEEKTKILIIRILIILGVILPIINIFLTLSSIWSPIIYLCVSIVLIIIFIKPKGPIPLISIILLILGVILFIMGIIAGVDINYGIIISGIIIIIAGILNLVIK